MSERFSGTLTGDQGSTLVIRNAELSGNLLPVPPPSPSTTPTLIPADANQVKIGTATYPLAAVNPTAASNPPGADYPGFRGPDQLVAYTTPGVRTATNKYGAEAEVTGASTVGTVTVGMDGGVTVPRVGLVLSGHGRAAIWLQNNCRVGVKVEFAKVDRPTPPPDSPGAPVKGRTLAVYMMDGRGRVSQVPPECTQIRVAFLRDGGLVEWGGDTPAQTAAALTAWRAARPGRQILLSIGGAGGSVALSGVAASVRAIEKTFPVDGIDWDIEGGALDVATAVSVSKALAAGREAIWVTSFVPPGGPPVATYLDAAERCALAGLRVQFGQQLYDAPVSQAAALAQTQLAVSVLGAPRVLLGMMVGSDANHWTVDQCEANMRAVLNRWPDIGGAYLWESAAPGTADWARRVGAALGVTA